ncbi:MAG: hypothetical protein OMM_05267 [Candidatus Magnetoglobus multicellularis str. Araruama]|uniref:Uncharacterized protein n=1 Tax=Candidatus Magnetoglobus multicellularis str. Araruama TaxID=890399 RepID=A0A1V1NXG5_9BACT|nr:MAG: hypothetical protein OMM_05267 [Candidatus Magnetoglobus multicellularis str. Araruama]
MIKGVSGNIGANQIFNAAGKLEDRIKKGDINECKLLLEELKTAAKIVFESIENMIDKDQQKPSSLIPLNENKATDSAELISILKELKFCLEENDLKAIEYIEQLKTLVGHEYIELINQLEANINDLEFTLAIDLLKKFDDQAGLASDI